MPEQELFTLHYITLHYITLHYITLHYIIYWYGFTLVFCNLHCIYHHNHHHTVQVAMCAYSFVNTLVNALVLQGKTPPAQVAAGDDHHDCKWSIFASWWKEKHHQRKLHSVKTILGTSIGVGCSNQIQVAQGQDLHYGSALVQAAFGCCIPLLYLYPRWS